MAIRLTGLSSGLDTDSMVKELVSAYSLKKENIEKQKTKMEWKQEAWSSLNTKIYGFYTGSLSSMRMASSFANKKNVTVSDPTKAIISAGANVVNGTQTIEINRLAKAGYLTSARISSKEEINPNKTTMADLGLNDGKFELEVGGETKTIEYKGDETLADVLSKFKTEAGINASFDTKNQRIIMNSETGKKNDFQLKVDETNFEALSKLGLVTEKNLENMAAAAGETLDELKTRLQIKDDASFATKQDAEDAEIVVNGAVFVNDSNKITVNGLTINATAVTNGAISVTTASDTDGIYNMVKDFLKGYNDLINEITKSYNAKAAKGYEPLSAAEKEEMSDKEVEKWEEKIKDSIFRRDDTLNTILSSMTSAMQKGFTINGKSYNLSSFGIQTQGFLSAAQNEHNAMHIAGDKADTVSADGTDKLRAAIESDPETVTEFFNKLAKNFYDSLTDKMKSTTLSSAYTVYNDKQMKTDIQKIEKSVKDWETKISNFEEKWYKQFAQMEKSLSTLQSQTSSLTALLGN